MPDDCQHSVMIERRGVAHRARCACGWAGHSWNELRPAEADAWHHTFGDDRVVDVRAAPEAERSLFAPTAVAAPVDRIVGLARTLARGPAPHRPVVIEELSRAAGESSAALGEAHQQIGDLLRRHARRSRSTADEEWLELHTARQLIEAAREQLEI
jgi:hypothetical protein